MLEGDDSATAVGKRLRRLRQMAGLSREGLAQEAEVGKSSITFWEHAKAKNPMTPRSRAKILGVIRAKGIDCNERWLLTGLGIPPRPSVTSLSSEQTASGSQPITQKLISVLDEEIKLFTSISEFAVIIKIDHASMSPILEKGDIVGGIWQSASTLVGEKICIIEVAGKLQIRKVKRSTQENHFSAAYIQYDPTLEYDPFVIDNLPLIRIAPIIRVWR